MKVISRLKLRLREEKIKDRDVLFEESDSDGGLQSRRVFELIALLSDKANEIAALMLKWRKGESDVLC